MENILSFFANAWQRIVVAVLCVIAAISAWINPPIIPPQPKIEITATVEEIDLSLPESQQYIDWYNAMVAERIANPYAWRPADKNPELCDITWIDVPDPYGQTTKLRNLRRDWDETTEIVIEHSSITDSRIDQKFFLRNKLTSAEEMIVDYTYTNFGFPITWFYVQSILDDRYLLYLDYTWDGHSYYLYDRVTKKKTYVAIEMLELSDTQLFYLHLRSSSTYSLALVDARKLAAGDRNARRILVQFDDDYHASIYYISHDKRFVHVDLSSWSGDGNYRAIYDVETGAQVAFFEIPWGPRRELVSDDLEYIYWDDPNYESGFRYFYVVRYERKALE